MFVLLVSVYQRYGLFCTVRSWMLTPERSLENSIVCAVTTKWASPSVEPAGRSNPDLWTLVIWVKVVGNLSCISVYTVTATFTAVVETNQYTCNTPMHKLVGLQNSSITDTDLIMFGSYTLSSFSFLLKMYNIKRIVIIYKYTWYR